jgi:hypothetical protein
MVVDVDMFQLLKGWPTHICIRYFKSATSLLLTNVSRMQAYSNLKVSH